MTKLIYSYNLNKKYRDKKQEDITINREDV